MYAAAGRSGSLASSGGDTSRYVTAEEGDEDEDEDLTAVVNAGYSAALGDVNSPQDIQAAYDRAAAYYDNAAYQRDSSNNGRGASRGSNGMSSSNNNTAVSKSATLGRAAEKREASTAATQSSSSIIGGRFHKRKSKPPSSRRPPEVPPEAATTAVDKQEADEASGDDFGFKYRPAIAPPRPLLQSGEETPTKRATLTAEDTLSMKRSQQQPQQYNQPQPPGLATSSGILLETNIDSELDDNSSIPSSYYPDTMKQPPVQNGLHHQTPPPPVRIAAAFQFNTAVKEEEEDSSSTEAAAALPANRSADSETATDAEDGRSYRPGWSGGGGVGGGSRASSMAGGVFQHEEVPRMASWSPRSPNSPSLTVIENGVGGSRQGLAPWRQHQSPHSRQSAAAYKSPTGTSLSLSSYSQAPPVVQKQLQQQHQQHQQPPPRMLARLDTDFEISTDEVDFTETTPNDIAILEYSRALEEAERMRHLNPVSAGGNYVFAQPPNSQFTNSVPEYINYIGRDSATLGSVGLRARSMNTLNSSRNSLRGSGSGKVLLTPGRARRASLRRSRLGLQDPAGGAYSIRLEDDTNNPALASGNSRTNILPPGAEDTLPEVQHHGPVRSSSSNLHGKSNSLRRLQDCCCHLCDTRCPNTPRKVIARWLLIGGICLCCVLLAVAIAVIVVSTRQSQQATSDAA